MGLAAGLLAAGLILSGCEPEGTTTIAPGRAMKNIAKLGEGFVVWERQNRGKWEIWTRPLEGGRDRRLAPRERNRDQFAPKISPGGRFLAYISFPRGKNGYQRQTGGFLWVYDLEKNRAHKIAEEARTYGEDRAVAWFDDERLCFIDAEGFTVEMNVLTRESKRITNISDPHHGWLVNSTKTHATTGTPEFAPYKAGTLEIEPQNRHAGCQPYFTQDGEWGYWGGGAGGPVLRMRLSTRLTEPLLSKNSEILDPEWSYVYFPMISPCRRLLAFGASKGDHDHFKSDYEIFVARIEPDTLKIISKPVRYTESADCDRYPDVFRRELPLGSHFVEGETELDFPAPVTGMLDWFLDGVKQGHRETWHHRFREPGDYWIEAKRAGEKYRGYVHVEKPLPPKIATLRRIGADAVMLHFSERVDLTAATIRLDTGEVCDPPQAQNGGLSALVKLPEKVAHKGIVVRGVRDGAQRPNLMPEARLRIPGQQWPAATDGLVFAWSDNKAANKMEDGFVCRAIPQGRAFWNEHHGMSLGGGWFDAPDAGERIAARCQKTNRITVEMLVRPLVNPADGTMRYILTMATTPDERNITLGQKDGTLSLWLATSGSGPAEDDRELSLCNLTPHQSHHVIVRFRCGLQGGGVLGVMVDGEEIKLRAGLDGDFSNWVPRKLRFGAAPDGSAAWRGVIEGVAVYDRLLNVEESLEHFASAELLLGGRGRTAEWEVKARLVEASRVPSLHEILPYKNALVKHRWEIIGIEQGGDFPHKEIVCAQWGWLGGEVMTAQGYKAGDEAVLTLHRLDDHPEVKSLVVKDDLTGGFDADQFFDAGWPSQGGP